VGGIGGVTEGLWNGLPELCFPSHFEQRESCTQVQDAGAGLLVDKENFSAQEIAEKFKYASNPRSFDRVRRLVSEPKFRERAQHLSNVLKSSGGLSKAIQTIETAIALGTSEHLIPYGPAEMSWIVYNSLDVVFVLGLFLYVIFRTLRLLCCCGRKTEKQKTD
jgi:hypothetical protein